MLGIIGRGRWGDVYAKTLTEMGISYRQMGRSWNCSGLDGVIVASTPESHYSIAKGLIQARMPCIIEKPLCFNHKRAERLLKWAQDYENSIVFVGHTRLFSPAWREFKKSLPEIVSVYAESRYSLKLPEFDWGSHLAAMCLDLGFDPRKAQFSYNGNPLMFKVNGRHIFDDPPTDPMPLNVLITEFMEAIKKGDRNISHLEMGVEVMRYLDGA